MLTTTGEIFQFVAPEATPAAMSEFVAWLRGELESPGLPLPTLLAHAHHAFIRIHPFDDGNGRVVRLLLNYVLLRAGLLPIVVKSRDRHGYWAAIALADAGDLAPLASYFEKLIAWSLALGMQAAERLIELESDEE